MTTRFYHHTASILLAAALALSSSVSFAYAYSSPNESDLDNHQTYRNHDGETVHSPARSRSGQAPDGATAQAATAHGASAGIAAARVRGMAASQPGAENAWVTLR
jgi:Protein of unknown function (DUF3761)